MVRKLLITAVAIAAAVAGLVSGHATGVPVASVTAAGGTGCERVPAFPRTRSATLARPDGAFAVSGQRLVSLAAGRSLQPPGLPAGSVVKHIAVSEEAGAAYVVDRVGDDDVVVVTPEGTSRIRQQGEATHPAWSAEGDLAWATGSSIAVLDAATGRVSRLASPIVGATVFSPVFVAKTRVAAVVSMPPTAEVPEGERLGNLWVTRLGGHGWRRLTTFTAGTDRWVTVRTPIVHRGDVHFVKVSGRGSASRQARFELWKLDHGVVRRVSRLPEERYLAGSRGAKLVWNVPHAATGRQVIAVDGPRGLREIGCGSVMTDPLDVADPDRRAGTGHNVPPRGDWPELAPSAPTHMEEIAVIVGDFVTSAEAAEVVVAIRAAFPSSQVEVVDSSSAPSAIKPGVFGALLHLPHDADPTVAMAEFRSRMPEFASNSWIVTP